MLRIKIYMIFATDGKDGTYVTNIPAGTKKTRPLSPIRVSGK